LRELDLSADLRPAHHEVLRSFGLLSRAIGPQNWCIVGGMMVLAAARSAGRTDSRGEGTKDGDILVDVVAEPGLLGTATSQLRRLGYEMPSDDFGLNAARCTFISGRAQLDLLAPDDADALSLEVDDLRTIAIPGGRRALEGSELTRVYYAEDAFDVEVRLPTLTTAICVKAAASADPRTGTHPRHAEDVAFLLACVEDPLTTAIEFSRADLDLLRILSADHLSARSSAWLPLNDDDRARGRAALDLILNS
jgi:hypothetical protein